ncbi:MAG: potassium transporter Kup [Gemmatimonadaceae bacterium]
MIDQPERPPASGGEPQPTSPESAPASADPESAPPQATTSAAPSGAAGATGTAGATGVAPAAGHPGEPAPGQKRLGILALAALGVVFGDIGTSPLYALKECFSAQYGIAATKANVYGVLSLVVWSLTLLVTAKYVLLMLRADNRGEGGILALLALIQRTLEKQSGGVRTGALVALGLFGSALLYGDGVITPAVSVLSAVEGLRVATPALSHLVVPLSVIIIFALFTVQRFGTGRVGVIFGPITALWFVTIAILGTIEIAREPEILFAVNPWYGIRFFAANGREGFFVLGAVVLVVTGAEALYADMGHFGRRPIRIAWLAIVFPALLLNYFGQGGLLLRDATATENPFYRLVPAPLLYPMVVLATSAAVIASQALISGAYSLTQQAMQLGYTPRVRVVHTSRHQAGQIYIPEVNSALMIACILLVVTFRTSGALAAAYGIAVTGTMAITTLLFYQLARHRWGWPAARAATVAGFFLAVELAFMAANLVKIQHGGWVPLVIAGAVYFLMTTWKQGRATLRELLGAGSIPLPMLLRDVQQRGVPRVPGTAVFMTSEAEGAPVVLLHHLKHNKVLHEQVVLLSVGSARVPSVPAEERLRVEPLGNGFFRVMATYGFMETPNVPELMTACAPHGIRARPLETSYFLGRERLIAGGRPSLRRARKVVFAFMSRNARSATEFFGLPPNRVVELGAQIEF